MLTSPSQQRSSTMADRPTVLGVATYPDKDSAVADFRAVWAVHHEGEPISWPPPSSSRGSTASCRVDRHDTTATAPLVGRCARRRRPRGRRRATGGRALERRRNPGRDLGRGSAASSGTSGTTSRSRQLLRMSDLLESGQAALVIVAVDHRGSDIEALLQNATADDRHRDGRRRRRAGLRGGAGRRQQPLILITTRQRWRRTAERRQRRWTSSVSVLPATMHTTLVASTSSAPPPPSLFSRPMEHPR